MCIRDRCYWVLSSWCYYYEEHMDVGVWFVLNSNKCDSQWWCSSRVSSLGWESSVVSPVYQLHSRTLVSLDLASTYRRPTSTETLVSTFSSRGDSYLCVVIFIYCVKRTRWRHQMTGTRCHLFDFIQFYSAVHFWEAFVIYERRRKTYG